MRISDWSSDVCSSDLLSDNCRMPQDASGKLGSIQTINQEIFMSWVYLAIAIAAEIVATTALKASNGFSGLYPSVLPVVGYSLAFSCLALTLRVIPVEIGRASYRERGGQYV